MSSAKSRRLALFRKPGTHLGMELKQEFWDEFGLDLVIDGEKVVFTQSGRDKYTPLLLKWGYRLASVRTVADFKRILRRCNACELEEANQKLAACLQDPSVPDAEKDFIRKLLGPSAFPLTPVAVQPAAVPTALRGPRAVRPPAGLSATPESGQVVHVDFGARKVRHPAD